ncbi:MAG: hypothetical protein ACTSWN_02325, partial [Promethearchaeota archaeon]
MKIKTLWKWSKFLQHETYLTAHLEMAGSQRDRILQKIEKNIGYIRTNENVQTVVFAFMLGLMNVTPILALINLTKIQNTSGIDAGNFGNVMFTFSLAIATYYLSVFFFLFIFRVIAISYFMSGALFKFLTTIPLSRRDRGTLIFLAYLRINLADLIVLTVTFPIASLIVAGNPILFLTSLACNLSYEFLFISLLIKISGFISRRFLQLGKTSRASNFLRIFLYVGYVLALFFFSLLFNFLSRYIHYLFENPILPANMEFYFNIIFSLIIVPFSGAYLVTFSTLAFPIASLTVMELLLTSLIGFSILFLLTVISIRSGILTLSALYDVKTIKGVAVSRQNIITLENIKVSTDKPLIAILKKNVTGLTREIGNFIYYFMALLLPTVSTTSFIMSGGGADYFIFIPVTLSYVGLQPFTINQALSGTEEKLGSIFSALPVRTWDIYNAKRIIMTTNLIISYVLTLIIGCFVVKDPFLLVISQLTLLSSIFIIVPVFYMFHAILFGKVENR